MSIVEHDQPDKGYLIVRALKCTLLRPPPWRDIKIGGQLRPPREEV